MMIKMKLMSYENHVLVHDGRQTLTIAHGQEFDVDAPDGKIVIEVPEVKKQVEAQVSKTGDRTEIKVGKS